MAIGNKTEKGNCKKESALRKGNRNKEERKKSTREKAMKLMEVLVTAEGNRRRSFVHLFRAEKKTTP